MKNLFFLIIKKLSEKILYNIRKAQSTRDPELFKKLNNEIWEFRTLFQCKNPKIKKK
jgi:hypothetical protein